MVCSQLIGFPRIVCQLGSTFNDSILTINSIQKIFPPFFFLFFLSFISTTRELDSAY